MTDDRKIVTVPTQRLSGTAITEMTQREQWNKKHPPTEATIVKDLRTTELVAREYRGTKARFYRLAGAIRLQPHLSELPPNHASVKHRHTTEAVLYIVKGKGHTVIHFEGEVVLRKSAPSAFWGTSLIGHLIGLGVDTLVIAGESTSGCVRATVVDGKSYRYRVVVPEPCVFDRDEASHAINLYDIDQKYADVVPLEEALDYLRSIAPTPSAAAR